MITLIYGGSGCGKSEFAEQQILNCSGSEHRYYIATMIAYGEEERERIRRHVALRAGKAFKTIECPTDLPNVLAQIDDPEKAAVLLECVSNLTANEMFGNSLGKKETEDKVTESVARLCSRVKHMVIVTNNLYDDGMDYDPSTVAYAEALGNVNRYLAALADEIYEVVAGIPVRIGGRAACSPEIEDVADDRRIKMKLVIGGYAQGKLEYVTRSMQTKYCVIDETFYESGLMETLHAGTAEPSVEDAETSCSGSATDAPVVIVNNLHRIIREIGQREAAQDWIRRLTESCAAKGQELVIISDEVGSGVIPIDAKDRQFREDTGRILCDLALEADRVERIICGLPQILK